MKKNKIYTLAELAFLSAIIILMSFTPLGYFKYYLLEITFLSIPVIIGSISLGPIGGAFLGSLFGLTSFIQAFGGGLLGTIMINKSIFLTFIVCFLPRLICGLLTGFIAKMFTNTKTLKFILPSIVAPLSNTVLFVGTLFAFYLKETLLAFEVSENINVFIFFFMFIGWNALIEFIACASIGITISKAVDSAKKKFLK